MVNVMVNAWEIARAAVAKFGGKAREYFATALRMAWAEAKSSAQPERIIVVFHKDAMTFDVHGERGGRTFRSRTGLDRDGYREAYGYLLAGLGIKIAAFYEVSGGVKTFKGVKQH